MGKKPDTAKGEVDDATELAQAAIDAVKDKLSDPSRKDK
jgi:hypothetical protein